MTRKEKVEQLKSERENELNVIYEKYSPKFKELEYAFSIDEIISDGWVKEYFYPAMSSSDDKVYYYSKDNVRIFIHSNPVRVRKSDLGETIYDMEDLNDYYKSSLK